MILMVDILVIFINEEICLGLKKGGMLNVVCYIVELIVLVDVIFENLVFDLVKVDIGDILYILVIMFLEGV